METPLPPPHFHYVDEQEAHDIASMEGFCLEFLKTIAQVPHDPRWLAIARTHIEEGFMAAERAIGDGPKEGR